LKTTSRYVDTLSQDNADHEEGTTTHHQQQSTRSTTIRKTTIDELDDDLDNPWYEVEGELEDDDGPPNTRSRRSLTEKANQYVGQNVTWMGRDGNWVRGCVVAVRNRGEDRIQVRNEDDGTTKWHKLEDIKFL
jgi:hypothetical protein